MDRLIYIAMTGAKHTLGRQDAVAHNLANATSTGYRAETHRLRAVAVRAESLPTRAFVVDASVRNDYTPGALQATGRSLDVAIQGSGWIALAMPDGSEAYTRNGSLQTNTAGILQTRDGIPIQGENGPITIPPDSAVQIARDGTVSAIGRAESANSVNRIGRIKLVNPPEAQLERGADGLFRARAGEVAPADNEVALAGGHLESSNVNVVEEMVSLISLSRQFEMQIQMLRNAEENDRAGGQLLSNR